MDASVRALIERYEADLSGYPASLLREFQKAVEAVQPLLPAAERDALFDPFVRGQAGRHNRMGAGLGLFITRRVVEAHGGRVWVESNGRGATFHIELPTG